MKEGREYRIERSNNDVTKGLKAELVCRTKLRHKGNSSVVATTQSNIVTERSKIEIEQYLIHEVNSLNIKHYGVGHEQEEYLQRKQNR